MAIRDCTNYEISLKSDLFNQAIEDTDRTMAKAIQNMLDQQLDSCEITLKIKAIVTPTRVQAPTENNLNNSRTAMVPTFKYAVSSVLKMEEKADGSAGGSYELVKDEATGEYYMVDIRTGQASMFDHDYQDCGPINADGSVTYYQEPEEDAPAAALPAAPLALPLPTDDQEGEADD